MIMSAMWLGHGIRHNTVFDIWARDGYFRFSTHPSLATTKLAFNEKFLVRFLETMVPSARVPAAGSTDYDTFLARREFLGQIGMTGQNLILLEETATWDFRTYVEQNYSETSELGMGRIVDFEKTELPNVSFFAKKWVVFVFPKHKMAFF